jgi:hypothetical protein
MDYEFKHYDQLNFCLVHRYFFILKYMVRLFDFEIYGKVIRKWKMSIHTMLSITQDVFVYHFNTFLQSKTLISAAILNFLNFIRHMLEAFPILWNY